MSTKLKNETNTADAWYDLLSFKTDKEKDEHEAQILMFQFLSVIEQYQEAQGINRKSLAQKIHTSASYLTQLWRGNKPLNFNTIAKMKRALQIQFIITAVPERAEVQIEDEAFFYDHINKYHSEKGTWSYRNRAMKLDAAIYQEKIEWPRVTENQTTYESEAIPA